jgi:hypothetical protein
MMSGRGGNIMRIAFASCFSAESFPDQPVWDEIAEREPDHLVLLGDAIYMDCGNITGIPAVQQMTQFDFATRSLLLYRMQAQVANFASLVRRPALTTHVIWDDHDFLWNDAEGASLGASPVYAPLIDVSRATFAAFGASMSSRLATPIPNVSQVNWNGAAPPGYRAVDLGGGVRLHLTDGRSWRGHGNMLGSAQFGQLEAAIRQRPQDVHVIASGSVFEANSGECWLEAPGEHAALMKLAQDFRLLILSGDIHDNNLAAYDVGGGRHLYELTSSGAAVKTRVTSGSLQRNWGYVDIGPRSLAYQIWKSGGKQYEGAIDRLSWMAR